ncbi:MAG: fatty acid desaturase family protein [Pseudomonadota bacterium]
MSRVSRVSGKAVFGESAWAGLRQRSRWYGMAMVAHAWIVMLVAMAVGVTWPHPLLVIGCVALIGSRQLGLAILMHEAAHGLLHHNRRWNDNIGRWLCAWPMGLSLRAYRSYHIRHHTYAQQTEDPDLPLSAKFPVTKPSLVRKILRDLGGITFLRQRVLPLLASLLGNRRMERSDWIFLGSHGVALSIAWLAGAVWVYFVFWLLPMATWYMMVLRVRNIAEHACVPTGDDPWQVARTTTASAWARIWVAPYFVNYHAEHHLFMSVPCYRLPAIHQALVADKVLEQRQTPVADSYWKVLSEASGA